jgi:hypothetical protein
MSDSGHVDLPHNCSFIGHRRLTDEIKIGIRSLLERKGKALDAIEVKRGLYASK